MVVHERNAWTRGLGRHVGRRRLPGLVLGVDPLLNDHPQSMSLAHGLSRRALISGLSGLGLLLEGAGAPSSAAAQGAQPRQCGGDPGIEALLAYSQGTIIPNTLRAVDPRWPAYMNPISPTISFRHPPGWQPIDLPVASPGVVLLSPQQDALVTMSSAQAQVYVPMDQLLAIAMQAVFMQYLRQPIGQQLCGYPLARSVGSEVDFAAAQNRTTLAAVSVSAVYSESSTLDANFNQVPTINTTALFYAVAGPSDQFAALTETVFLPIFGQLMIGAPRKPEDMYEEEDGGDEG